jgi:hypothetical protein
VVVLITRDVQDLLEALVEAHHPSTLLEPMLVEQVTLLLQTLRKVTVAALLVVLTAPSGMLLVAVVLAAVAVVTSMAPAEPLVALD